MIIFVFILGLCIGSFLNVLIDRLPAGENIMGRSHCDHCKKKLEWIDLIPVVSFIVLGGKCRRCKKKLSWYYPVVEILTGVVFVGILFFHPGGVHPATPGVGFVVDLVIACSLIVIFFADLKYHIIPDSMTVAFTLFAFIMRLGEIREIGEIWVIGDYILAGILLSLFIYLFYFFTKGRGMGFGDVKLAFPIGLLLGPALGFMAIYIGFVTGGIFALGLLLLGKKKLKSKIAFGPFMVIGVVVAIIWGKEILGVLGKWGG